MSEPPLVCFPTYAQLPLCINPGTHYFQLDHIKADTAVCTRCGLIRKPERQTSFRSAAGS